MRKKNNRKDKTRLRGISRRDFLRMAAVAGLLAGCSPDEQAATTPTSEATATFTPTSTHTPTDIPTSVPTTTPTLTHTPTPTNTFASTDTPAFTNTPLPTEAPVPTNTPVPTDTPVVAVNRQDIIRMYPDVPSKVIHTHHTGAWNGENLSPEVIQQMLDASITNLTGLNDANEAWSALFDPGERIAIKVNTIAGSGYWTHVSLVMAVTERLQAVGVMPERIIVFDRSSQELERAGYLINKDNSGVRCYGTDGNYTSGWTIMDTGISLSSILLECDALINIPLLKQHSITGLSFAMKNHYGTFNKPGSFHGKRAERGIPELNALAPLKERTRLIIGDALDVVKAGWYHSTPGDSILMSFDPVALDTVGLQVYNDTMMAEGNDSAVKSAAPLANAWLTNGAELGLGSNDPDNMELIEVNLG
jgi:uncharacterized protein (DUF362 family)